MYFQKRPEINFDHDLYLHAFIGICMHYIAFNFDVYTWIKKKSSDKSHKTKFLKNPGILALSSLYFFRILDFL